MMVVKLSPKKYLDLEVPPGMMAKVVKGIYFDVFNFVYKMLHRWTLFKKLNTWAIVTYV